MVGHYVCGDTHFEVVVIEEWEQRCSLLHVHLPMTIRRTESTCRSAMDFVDVP